jgi:hypothetical protein
MRTGSAGCGTVPILDGGDCRFVTSWCTTNCGAGYFSSLEDRGRDRRLDAEIDRALGARHARRMMMDVWSYLRRFAYTKYVAIVDEYISMRDTVLVENTPLDYLDFASPASGLGGEPLPLLHCRKPQHTVPLHLARNEAGSRHPLDKGLELLRRSRGVPRP